jgi:SpoVK/Ycf46/Vps4 family AAA+-type ATPase
MHTGTVVSVTGKSPSRKLVEGIVRTVAKATDSYVDEMFSVSFPNEIERAEIFAIHLTRIGRLTLLTGGKIDVDKLVEESEGYSGAEIEACIIEGLFSAFHEGRELEEKDIVGALEATTPLSQTAAEKMAALAKWCEHRTRPANRQTDKAVVGRSVEAN